MFKNLPLNEFLDDLSSNSPAPGGGSVAALSSALAASLGSMVANLTIGKKSYNELSEENKLKVDESLKKCLSYKEEYVNFIEEDAQSFLKVMDIFKLPKETEEEKLARSKALQEGYKVALEVPKRLCEETLKVYPILGELANYGNKNAISDVGVAVIMAHASIESALLNVIINLGSIKDGEYVNKINAFIEATRKQSLQWKEEISKIVAEKL